jgi:hypothetical protein
VTSIKGVSVMVVSYPLFFLIRYPVTGEPPASFDVRDTHPILTVVFYVIGSITTEVLVASTILEGIVAAMISIASLASDNPLTFLE